MLLDLHSKKGTQTGVGLTRGRRLLLIPLLHARPLLSLPLLSLLVFLISTMSGIFGPALYSALPLIVRRDVLLSANALIKTTGQIGLLAGPVLGGILGVFRSPSGERVLDAVAIIVSALFLLFIKIGEPRFHTGNIRKKEIFSELPEGFLFVFEPHRTLLAPFLFMALKGLVTGPITIFHLVLSRHLLKCRAEGFGDLMAAFGAGRRFSSFF